MLYIERYAKLGVSFQERLLLSACRYSYQFRIRSKFTVSFSQGPRKFLIPQIQGLGWNHLVRPPDPQRPYDAQAHGVISKLYGEGRRGCFVDIGANEGRMLLLLLYLDLDLSYLGFEPQLEGAYYIQELIRANKLKRHNILATALGSKNFMVALHRHFPMDATATYTFAGYSPQGYSETVYVPVSTADDQLRALEDDIFLVKLDTEGSEAEVLKGMNRTLQEKRPPVYFEVMGYRNLLEGTYSREFSAGELPENERLRLIENRRANMEILDKFWRKQGYTIYFCREDGTLRQAESIDPGPQSHDNRGEMNYLAMPN